MRQTIDTNLMQSVYFSKYAVEHLIKSKGVLVAISSVAGLIGNWGSTAYSASKHAIHGFFKSLRLETRNKFTITIVPVPYVATETALDNLKPKNQDIAMSTDECARRLSSLIPARQRMPFMTWETWFGVHLGVVSDYLLDFFSYKSIIK
eukprot:TRINITY_DN4862_c0_g1_i2.p1 TRINITY_DN4862_c0_g1~~TRINITY_DN4862_c0_g1_i2.p1  ORF type:complete len:149 (-),score=27.56 TRINITY_DN4862_c0_g1_i2:97-543(-)